MAVGPDTEKNISLLMSRVLADIEEAKVAAVIAWLRPGGWGIIWRAAVWK
jgi:hypothetical protein